MEIAFKERNMAKARSAKLSSMALMMLALGLFFTVLGISGIIPQAGEGIFGFSKDRTTLEVVFGVLELLCGAFLLFDAVKRIPSKTSSTVLLVIFALWVIRIVVTQFIQGLDFDSGGIEFQPTFWSWMLTLSTDLVVAAALWLSFRNE